jgi:hypothetical protein
MPRSKSTYEKYKKLTDEFLTWIVDAGGAHDGSVSMTSLELKVSQLILSPFNSINGELQNKFPYALRAGKKAVHFREVQAKQYEIIKYRMISICIL